MSASNSSTSTYTMMTPQDLASLRKLPGNLSCIDCGKDKPEWASVSLAVFMCLECSGQHRALGSHVSFVRSIKMDSWSTSQLERMRLGGNTACQVFLAKHGIDVDSSGSGSGSGGSTIRDKYDTPAAQLYQQVLKARIDGTPEPTELPLRAVVVPQSGKTRNPSTTSTTSTSSSSSQSGGDGTKKVMEGFGSSPVPEPSRRDQRRRAVLGVGVAAVGAIAIGLAASKKKWNQHKQQQKQKQQSKCPATVATQ